MENQKEILKAVNKFIIGGDTSDLNLLNEVLHPEYSNVQNGFFGEPGIYVISKQKYLSLIEEKTFGGIPREMEVEYVNIEGNIAMVKANLKSEQLIFKSFISLVQAEDNAWQVIGNFPHVVKNEA